MHVIVDRDGRRIEIQLRTPGQHEWAVAVDRTASRLAIPELKDGNGPADLTRFFERIALAIALAESDQVVDDALRHEIGELRKQVRRYFEARG